MKIASLLVAYFVMCFGVLVYVAGGPQREERQNGQAHADSIGELIKVASDRE